MKIGTRVAHEDGNVGHVEEIDGDFIDVRWLTPNNELSCCVSLCHRKDLEAVGENVVPMPRSEEWWEESRQFCAAVAAAIEEAELEVPTHDS